VKFLEKCKFNLKENLQTRSVYCGKLQQWVSSKYCALCFNREAAAPETKTNNKFSLSIRYVSTYLRTYLRPSSYQKPNQNTPKHHNFKLSLIKNFVEVFSG
jgi:hypothetical protein